MNRGRRRIVALFGLVALGLSVFVALRWRVTSDITHFLPAGRDHEQAQLSRQLADSALTRTLILSLEGPDEASAVAGAAVVAEAIASHPEVAWL
jgi:predicted exporter